MTKLFNSLLIADYTIKNIPISNNVALIGEF